MNVKWTFFFFFAILSQVSMWKSSNIYIDLNRNCTWFFNTRVGFEMKLIVANRRVKINLPGRPLLDHTYRFCRSIPILTSVVLIKKMSIVRIALCRVCRECITYYRRTHWTWSSVTTTIMLFQTTCSTKTRLYII